MSKMHKDRFFLISVNDKFTQPTTNLNGLYEIFKTTVKENPNNDYAIVEVDENLNYLRLIASKTKDSLVRTLGNNHCEKCNRDVPYYIEFKAFHCTYCGNVILPCNLCDKKVVNCDECPLKSNQKKYLVGGIVADYPTHEMD